MGQTTDWIKKENQFCAPNYHPLSVVLTKGEGVWLWDIEGNKYLDMMSAYSAVSHGHSHPRLVKALSDQAKKLCIPSRAFYNDQLAPFLEKLCQMCQLEMALPMNTGAEAVETAIKAARRWAYEVKKVPDNQAEIITANNNFHGRTVTITSFSTEPDYRRHFGPFTPGFKNVPFGDAQAIEAAITPNTAAVLVEPMQGEAGIIIPPKGWLKAVREICDKHNVLLLLDEIQTGLGRTGALFAFEHEGIKPDGLILGKALGGGMMPISAFVSTKEVLSLMKPGSHGSTFGGNPLAGSVGLEALKVLEEDNYAQRAQQLGDQWMQALSAIEHPGIKEVRGKGLWIGIECDSAILDARRLCEQLMRFGILAKEVHETVVRLAPPLIIEAQALEHATATLKKCLP
ncbi:MAG: ornithine--oxo-acid transaminase [Legionellales bacterium]|nr:ornithine--oxo-acid transaminase [Legionellales bacterium]|tara:strand:- start:908 stop:2107 length:1200 start_codon:yes stop_codon:yes gene_type:complete